MMNLEQLKNNMDIINAIDWEMTPEEAVRLYLEWGNNWVYGKYVIRSNADVSVYFIVYNWDDTPVIYLIRRDTKGSDELAKIRIPENIKTGFLHSVGYNKGVYALDGEVKNWLQSQILSN